MASNFLVNVNGILTDIQSLINTKTATTVQISTNNPTNTQYNVVFNRRVAIRTNDISVGVNGYCLNGPQVYTFGPSQRPMSAIGHQSTTTFTFSISTNDTTWYGLNNILNDVYAICYNGKLWVAGGCSLTIFPFAYSWDGLTWTGCGSSIFTTSSINGVSSLAWNGKMFVAGGLGSGANTLAYSYDGINWIGLGNSIFTYARYIGWNGKLWVAVGYSASVNKAAYSTDGINWTASTTSFGTNANGLFAVFWNGLTWIIGGTSSTSVTLWYSINGITWTPVVNSNSYITSYCCGVSWNGSIWSAGGFGTNNMAYTRDPLGQTGWVALGQPVWTGGTAFITTIKWNGRCFIGAGGINGSTIMYSKNGINWHGIVAPSMSLTTYSRGLDFNSLRPHTITIPEFTVVAGGQAGSNTLAYSNNGTTWTGLGTSIFSSYCLCVKYNGTIWVAGGIGANTLAYSYDAINWTGLGNSYFTSNCYSVCWNGTLWTGVGGSNICVSYDGILWIPVSNQIFNTIQGVACSNSMIVAVGKGLVAGNNIAYSYNGFNWFPTNQTAFSNVSSVGLVGISWNGTIWIAAGQSTNFSLGYSYDGIIWTGVTGSNSIFTTNGWNVDWNGQFFIATGNGTNYGAYSLNGINWTGLGASPSSYSYGILWDGTMWHIGYGGSSTSGYSFIGTSSWTTYTSLFGSDGGRCFGSNYGANPTVYIQQPTIAVGAGLNTIAYSEDGITWKGLGTQIFSNEGYDVAWNGSLWVAVGVGANTIAYSLDGINWTGLGNSIFSVSGNGIRWNGTYWVATGAGSTNTIAYSQNGTYWFGSGNSVFTNRGYGLAWNGTTWIATGQGGYTLAYSTNSINWTGIASSPFTTAAFDVATNGVYWVATGTGTTCCLAYTTNIYGSSGWTTITGVFDTGANVGNAFGIAWNGNTWVAVGRPNTSTTYIAYSRNAINWTRSANSPFTTSGLGVCWNGVRFIATGSGGNSIAYSPNGINWYPGFNGFTTRSTNTIFTTYGNGVCSNPGVGAVPIQSQLILNPDINGSSSLDIIAPAYYQPGYNNISIKIEQNNLY
jgi:hypothetical protein